MADKTSIQWADATFNPWMGCTKVSPGCDHCYAERSTPARTMEIRWGVGAPRVKTGVANWAKPICWNKEAAAFEAEHGHRRRVFCASLSDVFDNEVPAAWREQLWGLIRATPNLDWLILTKRIGNAKSMLPSDWHKGYPNVWLGITVVNQDEADRDIPKLLVTAALLRWLSIEPMLGAIDLERVAWPDLGSHRVDVLRGGYWNREGFLANGPAADLGAPKGGFTNHSDMPATIDWVVVGGESGKAARAPHPDWVRTLRDHCRESNVPMLFKQWGEWRPISEGPADWYSSLYKSRRTARDPERQRQVDDSFGKVCTVDQAVVHLDGSVHGISAVDAWRQGTGAMQTFAVGKARSGRSLDGELVHEFPASPASCARPRQERAPDRFHEELTE